LKSRRFYTNLAVLVAMTTLVLTSIGLHSALSHATKRHAHDIAIRIALGAKPADIRRMVLAQAVKPVATGMCAGIVVALGIAPVLRGVLFGTSPTDARVFAVAGIVLAIVSVVASYMPGLRASRVNPIDAIRSE
jgi:putative ABC transport system permease protein